MAYLELLYIDPYEVDIRINDLSEEFTPDKYDYAIISDKSVFNGATSLTGEILGAVFPEEWDRPTKWVDIYYVDLSMFNQGSSQRLYGITRAASDGKFYNAGSIMVRIPKPENKIPSDITNVTIESVGTNYIDIAWEGGTRYYYFEIYVDDDLWGATTNHSYTIDYLDEDTLYKIEIIAWNDNGGTPKIFYQKTRKKDKPDEWSWITNFVSGKVYNVLSSGGDNYIEIMPASEWNQFLARIDEYREYLGLSKLNKTYSKGTEFKATTLYNEAVNAINAMQNYFGSGYSAIPTKSQGSELKASDFDLLKNTLNSIE